MKIKLPIPVLPHKIKDKLIWANTGNASGLSLLLSQAVVNSNKLWLLVCSDTAATVNLKQELDFFLREKQDAIEILVFPDWETLPYDNFSPHKDIISARLDLLFRLPEKKSAIIIVSATNLIHKICPKEFIAKNYISLNVGDTFSQQQLENLQQSGYTRVDIVVEHGQYAVRGSIIDIFPTGSKLPIRIELFDDQIESLRTFNTENQLTVKKITSFRLLPANEFPLDDAGVEKFLHSFENTFDVRHKKCPIYQSINQRQVLPGTHYYLPLFFNNTATLFDYLPVDSNIVIMPQVKDAVTTYLADIKARFSRLGNDILRPLLPPKELVLSFEELYAEITNFSSIHTNNKPVTEKQGRYNLRQQELINLQAEHKQKQPFTSLLKLQQKNNILIVAENQGKQDFISELLAKHGLKITNYTTLADFIKRSSACGICTGDLDHGIHLIDQQLVIIPESLIFGKKVAQYRRQKPTEATPENIVRSLTELTPGDLIIHQDYGIGKYHGLEAINATGLLTEFVVLTYAKDEKIYLPITDLQMLERYATLDKDAVVLNSLSSDKWKKARKKAAEKALDVAADLLEIYSQRASSSGYSFSLPAEYSKFAESFPFEETIDQKTAIAAIIADLSAETPMDRLICGDVGFGKTEVAMRAAFIAAYSGKQVAILVPTTLLSQQHYETFQDRFSSWPLKIGVLSRFNSPKIEQATKQELATGILDIVIGTHKLLQKSIKFNNLGLLIIDEEHRFGVRDKEKIKALRANVDILALTATPIPRSLNMAMSGIRDLSILATPPAKRLSINTFVTEVDRRLIQDAISRELLRGGQVYYLHNNVDSIEKAANELQELVPNARVDIAHGQMRERQLEQVMYNFYHRKFNVLVCTTIIETGIDIPTANTIIINRADKLGLAQLHQLRGRVGRSHHQAYAYLLRPNVKLISSDARKRLDAIVSSQDLGAGFALASSDLEIRGAGDLLGKEQSGHIQAIGFSLYNELLQRAVNSLTNDVKFNTDNPLNNNIEIDLGIPALLPENYVYDVHMRLSFYKQLAQLTTEDDIIRLRYELTDRFGKLPEYAINLFTVATIKLIAIQLGVVNLQANAEYILISFSDKPNLDPRTIADLLQAESNRFKLINANTFKYKHNSNTNAERLEKAKELLNKLSING